MRRYLCLSTSPFFSLLVLFVGNDTVENEKLTMPDGIGRICWSSVPQEAIGNGGKCRTERLALDKSKDICVVIREKTELMSTDAGRW